MKILILILTVFFQLSGFSQDSLEQKSMYGSTYQVGDKIDIPTILYPLTCGGFGEEFQPYSDTLKEIANFIKRNPTYIFEFRLHTDSRGSGEANKKLCEYRGRSIESYLIENYKVNSDNFRMKAFGESQPIYTNEQINACATKNEKEEMYQVNRRTELWVIGVLE